MKKIVIGVIVVFLVYIGFKALTDNTPTVVKNAKTELWTEFHDNLFTAKCNTKNVEDIWFIDCRSEEDSPNFALFWVNPVSETQYELYAVNGKSKQYAKRFTKLNAIDFYNDGKHPKVQEAFNNYVSQ
ncbi:hypothetical protein [Vibrio rumoiensis]|uniref:hypothetical protein n=1 Tax=Vibrio rumoiensis TaxID=76258 RepID=UPI003AA80C04